ncbi:MAG TPA: PD-(D/E)XK nuclease family protein [Elusimicrobiota bacterium]|nr:PD-(D/E)XK nuclease family protein [Elusimicrobiota bacterium]
MKRGLWIAAALTLLSGALHAAPEEISIDAPPASVEALPAFPAQLGAGQALSASLVPAADRALGQDALGAAAPLPSLASPAVDVPAASAEALVSAQNKTVASQAAVMPTAVAPAAEVISPQAQVSAQSEKAKAGRAGAQAVLKSMAADIKSGKPGALASALGLYDGDAANSFGAAAADEGVSAAESLEVYFSRHDKKALESSSAFTTIRLMDTSGRRWHWGRFRHGAKINVHAGSHTLFVSQVQSAATKAIGKLVKTDFAGVYSKEFISRHGIAAIRKRLMEELAARNSSKPVDLESQVRVVHFMPFGEAKQKIAENKQEEAFGAVVERRNYAIPPALAKASKFLPKAVVLDLSLYPQGLPPEIIEDINKLMNAGVYFILTTDKPLSGPDSAEEVITKRLSPKQKDKFHRYKLVTLANGGNTLATYDGRFPKPIPMPRFDRSQRDLMNLAAQQEGVFKPEIDRPDAFAVPVPEGVAPEAFLARYETALQNLGLSSQQYKISVMSGREGALVVLRPLDAGSAIPVALSLLQDRQQLYVNPSDMMVISRDPRLLAATKGALQPAIMDQSLDGEAAADMAFASLLPEYRNNKPGDLATSASGISSFLQHRNFEGGRRETVEMFLGHVMHSAFNWAIWRYRADGVFPDAEALVARAKTIWDETIRFEGKMLALPPGQTMSAYYEDIGRLRPMHTAVAAILKDYPIVLGTELPNIFVVQRYKGSAPDYRDIFRLVYDFAAARETPDGYEVVIVDFKTGKTPTNHKIDKDVQPQLYEWVARQAWEKISETYGSSENLKPVTNVAVRFVYPTGAKAPAFNEWGRMRFEKSMKSVLRRIRKAWGVPLPGARPARAKAAAAAKGKGKKKASSSKAKKTVSTAKRGGKKAAKS